MTVPFMQIGPGQIGRFGFQVIGKNGPVFNPNNITTLPIGAPAGVLAPLALPELAAGLGALTFVVSVGTLAISAASHAEIKRIAGQIRTMRSEIAELRTVADEIRGRVEVIDVRVAEQALRSAMDHVLRAAVDVEAIDLVALAKLRRDVEGFRQRLPEGSAWAEFLATDVRDKLVGLAGLLSGVRRLVAVQHNLAVRGDPGRVVSTSELSDYLGEEVSAVARREVGRQAVILGGEVVSRIVTDDVADQFTFASRELEGRWYGEVVRTLAAEGLTELAGVRLREGDGRTRLREVQEVLAVSHLPQGGSRIRRGIAAIMLRHEESLRDGRIDLTDKRNKRKEENLRSVLEKIAEGTPADELDTLAGEAERLLIAWLWHTDAGLLWRVGCELEGIERGYEGVFWPHLRGAAPTEMTTVEVCGLLPEGEVRP